MINPNRREMMRDLYRMLEKYEMPPKDFDGEATISYYDSLFEDYRQFYERYKDDDFALPLAVALFEAIDNRWDAAKAGDVNIM